LEEVRNISSIEPAYHRFLLCAVAWGEAEVEKLEETSRALTSPPSGRQASLD
jgi:hypothetical protein